MIASNKSKLYYGWVVAAVAFCVLLAAAGIRATPGVLMVPLEREFGWPASTISAAVALNIALFGLCGPFAAAAMERFGVRKVVGIALAANGLAVSATAFVRTPGELVLLWGLLVGIATGVTANVFAAIIATRWFVTYRGLVVGILAASVSTGQMIFLPASAWLTTTHGWRASVWLAAGVALALVVPAVVLLRDSPAELGLPAYGAQDIAPPPPSPGNPIVTALRELQSSAGSRDFQLLFLTFFVCGASTSGLLGTHLIAACGDHGIAEVTAASFLAGMGVLDMLGTAFSGYLSDRFDSRILLFWYYALRGLSLLFLPAALALAGPYMWLFTAFYGLDWIATIPPTLKLTNTSFGSARGPLLYGWIAAGHQMGAGLAALGAGIVRTASGRTLQLLVRRHALFHRGFRGARHRTLDSRRADGRRRNLGPNTRRLLTGSDTKQVPVNDKTALLEFARRYTAAWCSQDAAAVAACYAPDGSLTINDGSPAVGRLAISATAASFMSAFPDMQVTMDDVRFVDGRPEYHWTLTGTNAGPGGSGKRVRFSGFERWQFGRDGLIAQSIGSFDNAAYTHQLEYGVDF